MHDICTPVGDWTINLRVAAIVRRGGVVLVCRLNEDWWFYPGGRIRAGETSRDAIVRELGEELGDACDVVGFRGCVENFFRFDGRRFHELCFVYESRWRGGEASGRGAEEWAWVSADEIAGMDVRPAGMKDWVVAAGGGVAHAVCREAGV
jgi:ADP-ribose pyrophosphatase YjhB (NUDIX family)